MTFKYVPTIEIAVSTGGYAIYHPMDAFGRPAPTIPFLIPTPELVSYNFNQATRVFDLSNYWTIDKIENIDTPNKIQLQTNKLITIDTSIEFLSKYVFILRKVGGGACCGSVAKIAQYRVRFQLVA